VVDASPRHVPLARSTHLPFGAFDVKPDCRCEAHNDQSSGRVRSANRIEDELTLSDVPGASAPRAAPAGPRPPTDLKLPGIVFGGHVTALGVVRCLGRCGIDAFVVSTSGDYAGRSRWSGQLAGAPPESVDPGPLAAFLESLPLERALLLPCSDIWLEAVAALPGTLRERFPAPIAPLETLLHFLDKARFAALVEHLDVPHPPTAVLREGEEVALERFDLDAPDRHFFLKPTDSQHFVQRFGVKAFAVQGRADATARLAKIWRSGVESMLVQEYIPGAASSHYFVDGFRGADGRTLGRLARRRIRMFPRDFGNSTYHATVSLDELGAAPDHLERMLDHVGFRGIFSAEFKRDDRDGELKILEVNVRPWWFVEFAAIAGVNVCELAHREALGLPIEPITEYTTGARCVLPGADVRAYVAQRHEGGMTVLQWLRSWRGASQPILSIRDPLPGVLQLKEVWWRWWARRVPHRTRTREVR